MPLHGNCNELPQDTPGTSIFIEIIKLSERDWIP